MAEIRPFRAWRYNQDSIEDICVYYQYYRLPGDPTERCRKGFICKIRIYDWEENVIVRHEHTMPRSVRDQVELLATTRLNVAPTHGLYSDDSDELECYMDLSMQHPLCGTAEDYQGVRDVMGVIHDPDIIARSVDTIRVKQVIMADGHHRYAGSLAYMKQQMAKNPMHTGSESYNFHLMWLTNTETQDLKILASHRLIKGTDQSSPMDSGVRLPMKPWSWAM